MSRWIDVTRPIDETLVTWPGRARPQQRWEKRLAAGDHCNVSAWQMSAHSGTHMDAPLHFIDGARPIDQIPPEVFMGDCRVVDSSAWNGGELDEATAQRHPGIARLLLKSSHSLIHPDAHYDPHCALMTEQAARLLLDGGLVLLGTDRLSVDGSSGGDFRLHCQLLGAGCVIVEGLALAGVAEGEYFLSATPLRLGGAEASPIRAFLKKPGG